MRKQFRTISFLYVILGSILRMVIRATHGYEPSLYYLTLLYLFFCFRETFILLKDKPAGYDQTLPGLIALILLMQ